MQSIAKKTALWQPFKNPDAGIVPENDQSCRDSSFAIRAFESDLSLYRGETISGEVQKAHFFA